MKIIISPAKKMRSSIDFIEAKSCPIYLSQTKRLLQHLKTLSVDEIKNMLSCNDAIATWSYQCYQTMDLQSHVVPALLAFDGIQYSYMKPDIFTDEYFEYAKDHVYLLSGFYGILRPFDGVVPYRLELDNPFQTSFCNSLYDFWKDRLYQTLVKEDQDILDLASKQYGRIIKKYATKDQRIVSCCFCEETQGRLVEKGVYVKMARGAMVRYLCEHQVTTFEDVKGFHELGYRIDEERSNEVSFIFTRSVSAHPHRKPSK